MEPRQHQPPPHGQPQRPSVPNNRGQDLHQSLELVEDEEWVAIQQGSSVSPLGASTPRTSRPPTPPNPPNRLPSQSQQQRVPLAVATECSTSPSSFTPSSPLSASSTPVQVSSPKEAIVIISPSPSLSLPSLVPSTSPPPSQVPSTLPSPSQPLLSETQPTSASQPPQHPIETTAQSPRQELLVERRRVVELQEEILRLRTQIHQYETQHQQTQSTNTNTSSPSSTSTSSSTTASSSPSSSPSTSLIPVPDLLVPSSRPEISVSIHEMGRDVLEQEFSRIHRAFRDQSCDLLVARRHVTRLSALANSQALRLRQLQQQLVVFHAETGAEQRVVPEMKGHPNSLVAHHGPVSRRVALRRLARQNKQAARQTKSPRCNSNGLLVHQKSAGRSCHRSSMNVGRRSHQKYTVSSSVSSSSSDSSHHRSRMKTKSKMKIKMKTSSKGAVTYGGRQTSRQQQQIRAHFV